MTFTSLPSRKWTRSQFDTETTGTPLRHRDQDGIQRSKLGEHTWLQFNIRLLNSFSSIFRDCDSWCREGGFNSPSDSHDPLRGNIIPPETSLSSLQDCILCILSSQPGSRFSLTLGDQRTNLASEAQSHTSRMGSSSGLRNSELDSQTTLLGDEIKPEAPFGDQDRFARSQLKSRLSPLFSTNTTSEPQSRDSRLHRGDHSEPISSQPDIRNSKPSSRFSPPLSDRRNTPNSELERHITPMRRGLDRLHSSQVDNPTTLVDTFTSQRSAHDSSRSSRQVDHLIERDHIRNSQPDTRATLRTGSRVGASSCHDTLFSESLAEPLVARKTPFLARWEGNPDVPPLLDLKKHDEAQGVHYRDVKWDSVWSTSSDRSNTDLACMYETLVWSYVEKCPINLFDTRRFRNISHVELKDDIAASLKAWTKVPLSCSELVDTLLLANPVWTRDIRPFVTTVMAKTPVIHPVDRFISTLIDEMRAFCPVNVLPPGTEEFMSVAASTSEAVRDLIERKRKQSSMLSHLEVKEQIELLGMYAILSHRWGEEELTFTDAANLCNAIVKSKKGFQKLLAFTNVANSEYGCRYLWMDTVCISDKELEIPRMFGWYRRAYVCIVYLATRRPPGKDPWFTRGWTLQEFLAARRIKVFHSRSGVRGVWDPHIGGLSGGNSKLDASKDSPTIGIAEILGGAVPPQFNWFDYEPGIESTIPLLRAMANRETSEPEDRVYCLLSALNIDIPIIYNQKDLDRAFYRLLVHYLTKTYDRRCLLWPVNPEYLGFRGEVGYTRASRWNSILPADFEVFGSRAFAKFEDYSLASESLPDTSISFDEDGVMCIMASIFPWTNHRYYRPQPKSRFKTPEESSHVFASLHCTREESYYGVLLRPIPWVHGKVVYERVSLEVFPESELPFHSFVKPEWVYIR